jgi:hypothetical protein
VRLIASVTNYRPASSVGSFAIYARTSRSAAPTLVNDYVDQFWTYPDGSIVRAVNNVPCDPAKPYYHIAVLIPVPLEPNLVRACR